MTMTPLRPIAERIEGYDAIGSDSIVLTETCVADLTRNPDSGHFWIACPSGREIAAEDWAKCLAAFPLRTAEFDWEFHIYDDLDVYVFHEIGEPLG